MSGGFQVMPRLTVEEYADLESSILDHGVQVPITVAPDGMIIDGHHRDEIARKHDLHCPRVTAEGSPETLRGLAFSLNLHRRHLTREQKRGLVAESIKSDPQLSDTVHAKRTGVSDKTATTVRSELESTSEIPKFDTTIGSDGKARPAARPRPAEPPTAQCIHCGDALPLSQLYEGGQGYECDPCVSPDVPDQDLPPLPENYMNVSAEAEPASTPKPITGPKPAVPPSLKRKPLPDAFDRAKQELRGAVQKIVRLAADDRLEKNKDQIVGANLSDLIRARDALTSVIQQLEG